MDLKKNGTVISTSPTTTSNPLIRTDLLTVWRKVHLEYDRMGIISGNLLNGNFSGGQTIGTGTTTLSVNSSPELQLNRFENGRMIVFDFGGNRSFDVVDFSLQGSGTPNANTSNTVRITNSGSPLTVVNGQSFILYDDDDYNTPDDAGALNGDTGDILPFFNKDFLNDNDIVPTGETTKNTNVLAQAYIRPTYDLTNSLESLPITLNIASDSITAVNNEFKFDNDNNEANPDFWTVYIVKWLSICDIGRWRSIRRKYYLWNC